MISALLTLLIHVSLAQRSCAQTIYMAGDSTMAPGGGGGGTDGWGQYLAQYLTLPVVNDAIAGTSARSYTDAGNFTSIINGVQSGDFVIIEFGHNDGSAGAIDNGREDATGDGYNATTTVVEADNSTLVVHSFNYYIQNAVTALLAKGAIPIVSSQTPDNIFNSSVPSTAPRFVAYAAEVAGNTSVTYVDHYNYVVQAYDNIGAATVNTYYPMDHLHTSPTGANVVAEAFVRGLLCRNSTLTSNVNSFGLAVPSECCFSVSQ
ncbi:SGNH hydrolase [Stereum hirsutum FP-91666 SS1]|uniref:SGNH hydrolase n=1 Tax=Stereum hirsutum (strain FP-91666) TaxID=721885 RepID=UPI000440C559|nr:SGNH hydrolase [Stereum hirsutum FP-91666 SS1]EIM91051.1 SGNH hydrolase [Stereum hirsutum FP-91666 SS1]